MNYCKKSSCKDDHLPCHSQCRMHAYLCPSIEIFYMGFWLTILLLWTWLYVTFLRSSNCQLWMQGVLSKSLHVMWKCWDRTPSPLDPLQLWCLNSVCLNGNPRLTCYLRIMPSYVVISFHKWPYHYITSCSLQILSVSYWGFERKGCSRVNLCLNGHYCLTEFFRLLLSQLLSYVYFNACLKKSSMWCMNTPSNQKMYP